jgi:hypothetical protein
LCIGSSKCRKVAKIEKVPLGDMSTARITKHFQLQAVHVQVTFTTCKTVGGKTTHHLGLVSDVFAEEIESLDGNSGTGATLGPIGRLRMAAESELAWSA